MRAVIALGAMICLCWGVIGSSAQTIEERAATCTACHGGNGLPKNPQIPIIWGQQSGYLYIQLRDFKLGTRQSAIMQPVVAGLEKSDMQSIAEFFAKKPWPPTEYKPAEADNEIGEQISETGMCAECHLDGFVGDGTMPRLAGQMMPYLEKTMLDFKTGARANNPDKSTLLASYGDDELAAMARYLAGQ
jgi:cytochrome c553